MKKWSAAILAIAAALLLNCMPGKGDNVMGMKDVKVVPVRNDSIKLDGSSISIINKGQNGGVMFKGKMDLRGYNRIRFKVTNLEPLTNLVVVTALCNEKSSKTYWQGNTFSGIAEDWDRVRPGETRTITVWFPCRIQHPEINEEFTLMRNTPYSCEHYTYNADLSDIARIEIHTRWSLPGTRWAVSDVELLKGKLKDGPEFMSLPADKFFPFIDKYGQFRHRDWPGKIHSDEDFAKARLAEEKDLAKHPGPGNWSKFGGWAAGPKLNGTGHFRVEKVKGKWWLVDPEGYLFWSHGALRVTPSSGITPLSAPGLPDRRKYFEDLPSKDDPEFGKFYSTFDPLLWSYYKARGIDDHYDFSAANCYRKYGPDYFNAYAEISHRRFRSWGLNTIANSSEKSICLMDRTPYCDRIEVVSKPIVEGKTLWWLLPDPFDEDFRREIDKQLNSRSEEIHDPWCIGYFVDNEHLWGDETHVAELVISADDSAAAKIGMRKWLKGKYGKAVEPKDASYEDKHEFTRIVIEKYFSTIREEFDRLAPGLLYMGCRFGGTTSNRTVLELCAKYCDIVSFNIYKYNLDGFSLPEGIDKPIMIGEFHFGAVDRGLFHPGQVETKSQKDRAACYKDYLRSALEHPNIVGTHWHQFSDQATTGRFDGEDFQVGFTDVCDTPYKETVEAVRETGYNMYEKRYGSSNAETVRIGTYNLRMQQLDKGVNDWETQRRARVIKSIRENDFDIFGVQEVTDFAQNELKTDLGDTYACLFFSPYSQDGVGSKAQGILYRKDRFKLMESKFFWYSDSDPSIMAENDHLSKKGRTKAFKRGFIYAIFKDRVTGKKIFFLNNHGILNKEENLKYANLHADIEKKYNPKGYASFFVGDFNARTTDPVHEIYRKWWKDAADIAGRRPVTFNGFETDQSKWNQEIHIDFIYYRNVEAPLLYECNQARYDGLFASDHFPVWADFKL